MTTNPQSGGVWTIRIEPGYQFTFPDDGPAAEQHLLEMLRTHGQPNVSNSRLMVVYTPPYDYDRFKPQS